VTQKQPRVDPTALARALAVGTHESVARQFGLSRSSITRKVRSKTVREQIAEQQRAIVNDVVALSLAATGTAIDRLVWLAENASSESVQATASKTLLDQAKSWFELGSLSAGLKEVHDQLEQAKATDDPYKIRAA
jgi:hypothetical protein